MFIFGLNAAEQTQSVRILLNDIVAIRQCPQKVARTPLRKKVVFQLFDRLAKSYRPHPDEWLFSQPDEDWVNVHAYVYDEEGLLNRLMKYGPACVIVSPLSLRESIQHRIQAKLAVF